MEKTALTWLLGANSARGFHSLYEGFPPEGAFLRVVKGGPGTGKSSFMRRIAEAAEAAGLGVEYIICSGDPDSLDAAFIHSRVYNRLSRLPGWDETQRAYYMELLSVPPFPRFSHPAEERIDLRRNIISPQDPQRAIESAETRDFEPAARDRLRSRILESITCSSARCSLRTARPSSKRSASISTCKTAMILIGSRVCST